MNVHLLENEMLMQVKCLDAYSAISKMVNGEFPVTATFFNAYTTSMAVGVDIDGEETPLVINLQPDGTWFVTVNLTVHGE